MSAFLPLVPVFVVIGAAIGLTGIGGVLLVPALVFLAGLGVHEALPACLASFLFTGAVGSWTQARHAALGRSAAVLLVAAGVGSATGLWLSGLVPETWPMTVLGVLALVSGVTSLVGAPSPGRSDLRSAEAVAVGAPVGVLSAITGTGGPVLLVPLLMLLRRPAHLVVALAQLVQLPIAGMGTLAAIALGYDTVWLGLVIGPPLAVGVLAGSWLKPKVSATLLRRILAVVLLVFGVVTLVRLAAAAALAG